MRRHSMSELEKEIATVEMDAIFEEQNNADENYSLLDKELERTESQIPYPETKQYAVTSDYDERERLKHEMNSNQVYWDLCKRLEKYCNNGSLYYGHLRVNNKDYYIMDGYGLETKQIADGDHEIWLLNANDRKCANHIRFWRAPSRNANVQLSRNITMLSRKISDVDVILDKNSELFSDISDAYLRKALIRNKNRSEMRSIIQTIQEKQNDIRDLPADNAFIVQGCAGSGKTMVLLHRLKYLLYNKDIYSDEYVFLVPSEKFKEFVDETSKSFNINRGNILTCREFYQTLLDRKIENQISENSELVFDSAYLERVYSKKFMQEVYGEIYKLLLEQTNSLGGVCDKILIGLQQKEQQEAKDEIEILNEKILSEVKIETKGLLDFTKTKLEGGIEDVLELIAEVESIYAERKAEYDAVVMPKSEIVILPDDERIIKNELLTEIRENIDAEKRAIDSASIFTITAHKNKLKKLEESYQDIYDEVINIIIKEEKQKNEEKARNLAFVYPGITIKDVGDILNAIKTIYAENLEALEKARNYLMNMDEYFREKYNDEILNLNALIDFSGDMQKQRNTYIEELIPVYICFAEGIKLGKNLFEMFGKYITDEDEVQRICEELPLFANKTENQFNAYLNTLLFNACKRKINREFDVKIHQTYKHYWYLALYCKYLTRPQKGETKKYLFIDEAQDLSVSEIELIYRMNSAAEMPVLNLFGDVNQTITTHGISDWSMIDLVPTIYVLEENFRNTNQVVDYCENNANVKMQKVGVDMEDVSEFKDIEAALNRSKTIMKDSVFIVKDEYSKSDLEQLLKENNIIGYEIYTVKEVKGLEFKEVFVFDSEMFLNEKYIAFTRALIKLNVIKFLPKKSGNEKKLIIQGEDQANLDI